MDKFLSGRYLNQKFSEYEKLKQKELLQIHKGITPLPEKDTDYSDDEWLKGYRFPLTTDDLKYLNRYWPSPKRKGPPLGRPKKEEKELSAEEVLEAFSADESSTAK